MPFAEHSTAKDEHTEKRDQKRQMGKDLEMCLSVSPGVYHEMDLPGISLQSRILFSWRRTEMVMCIRPRLKKGGEDNVISEISHEPLPRPEWEPCRGACCGAMNSNPSNGTSGKGFVEGTVYQSGEAKLAEELEESTYMQTCGTSCGLPERTR